MRVLRSRMLAIIQMIIAAICVNAAISETRQSPSVIDLSLNEKVSARGGACYAFLPNLCESDNTGPCGQIQCDPNLTQGKYVCNTPYGEWKVRTGWLTKVDLPPSSPNVGKTDSKPIEAYCALREWCDTDGDCNLLDLVFTWYCGDYGQGADPTYPFTHDDPRGDDCGGVYTRLDRVSPRFAKVGRVNGVGFRVY